jgi:adenine/guanine phosphoribosyltransferase-like PRPP-binding protein
MNPLEALFDQLLKNYPNGPIRNGKIVSKTTWLEEAEDTEWIATQMDLLRKGELPGYPKVEFDTIVGTGVSGLLPLVSVAKELGVDWLAVRKENDESHTGTPAEGILGNKWILLDDFVETGKTLVRVQDTIDMRARELDFDTKFVGVFQYHSTELFIPERAPVLKNAYRRFSKVRPPSWD